MLQGKQNFRDCVFILLMIAFAVGNALAYDTYNMVAEDLILIDLNGDSSPEIVATVLDSAMVMTNDGDGKFPVATGYYAGGMQASAIAAGQFDNDSFDDLVVTNLANNSLAFLSGNGDGSFNAPITFPTIVHPDRIAIGDFDNANGLDVVVLSGDVVTDSVYIHFNDGSGGFSNVTKLAADANPAEVVAGDLNGDSNDDLVICHWGTPWIGAGVAAHEIWIIFGNGDGTFQTPTYLDPVATVHNMVAGDFEGDGDLDLLIGSNDEDTPFSALTGWLNDGNGNFSSGGFANFFSDAWPWKMAWEDLDGNGFADVPVGLWDASLEIRIFANEFDGTIDTIHRTKPDLGIKALKIAELNGWGYPEMAVASGGTVAVYINVTGDCCTRIRGNVNYDLQDLVDITDLTIMVDCMFGGSGGPCSICIEETDVNGDGGWDIADLTALVDYLFGGGSPPAACLDVR